MTTTTDQPLRLYEEREANEAEQRWVKARQSWRPTATMAENALVFAVATAAYSVLGMWLVLDQHVLVFDGMSRLSHAYFAWWNAPPKLTAIGFVWPPVATLVFLPLAAIKPLATSLAALPLTSAVFGGLLLVMLNRLLTVVHMPNWQRYSLLAAFGTNPMIAFYAGNGMAEILYLFLLMGAIYAFMRWYLTRAPGALIFAAVFFALGILSRYEVFTWAAVLTVSIVLASIRQRVSRSELEGTLLTYLAPISYGVGLWLFFNWLILGTPFFFLAQQTPGAPLSPGAAASTIARTSLTPAQVGERVASLNWHLFPFAVIVLVALGVVTLIRRDLMSLTLIALLTLNAGFTWLVVVASGAESYLQLRYNMRAMPIALAGVAWIYLLARGRQRAVVWALALVGLVVSIPFTAQTMRTFEFQFREVDFMRAVTGGGGLPDQVADARAVARYVDTHVARKDAVLTDDSQTFPVILLSGRPDRFLDRIDRGDAKWLDVRDVPWGRVRYMLAISGGPDLVLQRYPTLATGSARGLTPVFRSGGYVLVRVAPDAPVQRRPITP